MNHSHTLLAVDDTPANLFVLKELVGEHLPECTLVTANSAEEGLALVAEKSLDGALIDVQMPGIDGIEMCRRLKTDKTNGHLPILLITAHGSTADLRIRGLEAGADDFIAWPIDNVELVAKIRVMLRIKRAEDELLAVNSHLEELVAERTRAALQNEQKYRLLAENAHDQIWTSDLDFQWRYISPSVKALRGYTPDEAMEQTLDETLTPASVTLARSTLTETLAAADEDPSILTRPMRLEVEMNRKDGSTVWTDLNVSFLRDDDGNPTGMLGVTRDIAERKRANEELARAKETAEIANQAKSLFLANMSHEIRTPMMAILGFTDLLMSYDCPLSERREHLQTIHRNATNLLILINDILDVSKIEAEKIELEPCDCSPEEVVEEVHSAVQLEATEKNLELDVVFSGQLPKTIRTDPVRLRQILVNLVGNAIKFTETGGVKIRVRLVQAEDVAPRMEFEVTDTGIGMSEEEIGRLFQPFTQVDSSHTRRFGGTGLGLHISRKLAKMLGGQVEVRSVPGVGSTFTLTIDPGPLENVEMEVPTRALSKEERPATPRPAQELRGRVLLADDVKEIRALIRMSLERLGLEVDLAENGRIAIEKASTSKAQGRPYDLILMDIQMPEMGGYQSTRCLRQDGWKGPIIALTAHAMTGDREKCLEAGCDDYISKPMTDEVLIDTIARHLGKATSAQPDSRQGIDGRPARAGW